jgi:hypothetical protein
MQQREACADDERQNRREIEDAYKASIIYKNRQNKVCKAKSVSIICFLFCKVKFSH